MCSLENYDVARGYLREGFGAFMGLSMRIRLIFRLLDVETQPMSHSIANQTMDDRTAREAVVNF